MRRAHQFARQLLAALPQTRSSEETNVRLNWVVTVCTVLTLLLALVTQTSLFSAPVKKDASGPKTGTGQVKLHAAQTPPAVGGRPAEIPATMAILHGIHPGVILVLGAAPKGLPSAQY